MDTLRKQVRRARRWLILQQFARRLPLCLFATLSLAVVAIAAQKFFAFSTDAAAWNAIWIAASAAAGLVLAVGLTFAQRASALQAAVEIDRRCELRERVSSVLALSDEELNTPVGQALAQDAARRVERIDVRRHFSLGLQRDACWPLVPALAAVGLIFFVPEREPAAQAAASGTQAETPQVKRSAEVLRKKLAERREQAQSQGLKDAEGLFQKLEEGAKKLSDKSEVDRKKGLVDLNDLARNLEKRRQALGGADKLKEQFDRLKTMRQGPAEKMAKALRDGNLKQAQDELKKLQDQLRAGKLDAEGQKQLAEQLDQMQKQMQQLADAHQQAAEKLQQQIEQAQQAGDVEEAARLQQKLDQLAQQAPNMQKLGDMAQQLGEASKNLQEGDAKQAAEALDQVADGVRKMQQELDEMEMLDGALEQIADAKEAMGCKACQGDGCQECGGGQKPGRAGMPGGKGIGEGHLPDQRDGAMAKTRTYDTRVRQKVGKGAGVIDDFIEGPNTRGVVRESLQAELEAGRHAEADPLSGQRLPRTHREHAQEYFDAFREGK